MNSACQLKFGIVTQVDAAKGVAVVHFDDLDIPSDWLPYSTPRSGSDKENDPVEKDDHVACLMDCNLENGIILGCIFSKANVPPSESGSKKWVKKFQDGTLFSYDKELHEYSLTNGTFVFTINRSTGFNIYKGSESLGKLIQDLSTQIAAITVTVSGSPTPINNLAAVNLIITRMATFFKS